MSQLNPAEIPGYSEAVDREQTLRDISFLDYPLPLCGVAVSQFNLRHMILLTRSRNAFMIGGRITGDDVLMFIWYVSQGYSLDTLKRDAFLRVFIEKSANTLPIAEIEKYLDDAFYDAPKSGGSNAKRYVSSVAGVVDVLATEYGWSDSEIMGKPLARIFQLMRCIEKKRNPSRIFFNRSEKALSDALAARMNGKS